MSSLQTRVALGVFRFRLWLLRTAARLPFLKDEQSRGRFLRLYREARWRRTRAAELLGVRRYSRPAQFGMDVRLAELIGDGGVFVEAGANDGFRQSNTYYLERFHGWSGVLVEAIPELAEIARKRRRGARVVNCALVADGFPDDTITVSFRDLMSAVDPQVSETSWGWERAYDVAVSARTLTSVLEEAGVDRIDLMSLDVEGHEESVLAGLDFDRFGPKWLLIEVRDGNLDRLSDQLSGYEVHEWLTGQDALLVRNGSQRTSTR